MEDARIIELYWQRDAEAVAETDKKYGPYCLAVAENILRSGQDAEECVNDTWLRAWNAMPPERPAHLRMFLAKITRRLALNRHAALTAQKRGGGELPLVLAELEECLAGEADVHRAAEARELEACLRDFVRGLPEREGDIFLRRYFFTEPVAVIARARGLTENHVAVICSRTRQKLKSKLIREGYFYDGI